MKWLRFLLGLCDHKWKIIETNPVYLRNLFDLLPSKLPVKIDRTLQCEKCGNIKKV